MGCLQGALCLLGKSGTSGSSSPQERKTDIIIQVLLRAYLEPRCKLVLNCCGRVLLDVEASLNEGALTLVNAGQPCLRIIFDLKAELQKKKTDWRLELGLGALQAFGLGGQV